VYSLNAHGSTRSFTDIVADLGNLLPRRCSRMDVIPGMAVDPHGILRPPWTCYGDEAAQLRLL